MLQQKNFLPAQVSRREINRMNAEAGPSVIEDVVAADCRRAA